MASVPNDYVYLDYAATAKPGDKTNTAQVNA